MFIRKDEYEGLCRKNRLLESELYEAKRMILEMESESNKHKCDSLCEGCDHLIETKTRYYSGYSSTDVLSFTDKACALDRECKDYKAKEQ